MKRFLLSIATLTILLPFTGCGSGTNSGNPGGSITEGSPEAQEYEKRRAEERKKGIGPKVPPPAPAH